MSPAVLSLGALLLVIVVSVISQINVGVLAIALAVLVALVFAGWTPNDLMATFPAPLFMTLVGVTLLFGVAQKNGTLEAITARVVRACGGHTALLPIAFFLIAGTLSAVGPAAIVAAALVAPLAMSAGLAAGIPPFLIALLVCNGANAGNLSPVSSIGLIVLAQMEGAGLAGHETAVFLANFVAHTVVAVFAYLAFGGLTLLRAGRVAVPPEARALPPLTPRHWITVAVLSVWIVAVVFFEANPGVSAFVAAAVLIVARTGDDHAALGAIPWAVIIMVCGVSVLIGVLDKTGGMDLFTTLLANITSPALVNGMMAFVTGLISTYSSTSGVVYPAFLPTVPGLVEKLGGGDPLEIALSINVGAALVDVSPLSTIGAPAIAAVPAGAANTSILFRQMLIWGFSMTVAGAIFCQLFIRFFAW
jgi:Na+/H+ antiporter NhaD/arsenite permease-like protein